MCRQDTDIDSLLQLEPYNASKHLPLLFAALNGSPYAGHPAYDAEALVWRYIAAGTQGTSPDILGAELHKLLSAGNNRVFVVLAKSDGAVIGTMTLLDNRPAHLVVEIGYIAITPVSLIYSSSFCYRSGSR
jgi:hypothetical protein